MHLQMEGTSCMSLPCRRLVLFSCWELLFHIICNQVRKCILLYSEADENYALLGYYTVSTGNFLDVSGKPIGPIFNRQVVLKCHQEITTTCCIITQKSAFLIHFMAEAWNHTLINPLNPELNPICYLLALLDHHFLHISRIRVKSLTLRLLMSLYIWSAYSWCF